MSQKLDLHSLAVRREIKCLKILHRYCLGIHFSYENKIENEVNNIKLAKKIENFLKSWSTRNLKVKVK